MFCPYCGTESTQGLSYCSRCGSNLSTNVQAVAPDARPAVQSGTAWAAGTTMLLLVILGLGILCALVAELSHSVVPPGTLFLITAAGAATILGSVFMVTRFWMQLLGGKAAPDKMQRLGARPAHTNELGPSRPGALPDARAASITEHTTRTLINK